MREEVIRFINGHNKIERSKVLEWAFTEDTEEIVALVDTLFEASERVQPPLTINEFGRIILHLCKKVIAEAQEVSGDFGITRYEAARMLYQWVIECFRQLDRYPEARSALEAAKEFLKETYINGEVTVRRCLVDGALEHIFEEKGIRDCFDDWKDHPILSIAYNEAMEWAEDRS